MDANDIVAIIIVGLLGIATLYGCIVLMLNVIKNWSDDKYDSVTLLIILLILAMLATGVYSTFTLVSLLK